jgi:hypothetical protein
MNKPQTFTVFCPSAAVSETHPSIRIPVTDDFNVLPADVIRERMEAMRQQQGWRTEDRVVASGSFGDVVVYQHGEIELVATD